MVSVTPYTVTYDGQSHTATVASITGANSESGATVGSVNVSNTTHTNAGTYSTDTWTFTGTANYSNISATTITDTINKATAVFSNLTASQSINFGASSVTLSGTIASGSLYPPTSETVTITIHGASQTPSIGANGAFTVSFPTATIPASATPYTISYAFATDTNFSAASDSSTALTVNKATPTTAVALTSGTTPSNVDDSLTFTATVTPTNGTTAVTGTVTFTDNANAIAACSSPVTLTWNAGNSNATATCTTTALTASGTAHTIKATYSGDSNYNTNNNTVAQTVNQASTSTTVASGTNPSTSDQSVTFTATVTPPSGSVALGGNITFTDGGNSIAACSTPVTVTWSGANSNATATCTTLALTASALPHSIVATYNGDSNYTTSVSATLPQTVNKANTTTAVALTAGSNPSTVDLPLTYTVTVTPPNGSITLTGTASFTDNGAGMAACPTATLTWHAGSSNATATCTTTNLTASGSPHTIAAAYNGDGNFNTSTGNVSQTVNTAVSVFTSLVPSTTTANVGDTVAFTATITAPGNGVPLSGNVTFLDNGSAASCTGGSVLPVVWASGSSTGTAICTTNSMPAGTHVISGSYGTDSNYNPSGPVYASTVNVQTNNTGTVGLAVAPAGSSSIDQSVSFTVTVNHTAPNPLVGTFILLDNGNAVPGCTLAPNAQLSTTTAGVETCSTQSLAQGPHSFDASYKNDPSTTPADGTATYTVNKETTNLVVASSTSGGSTVNQPVTFTATITYLYPSGPFAPAGTVAFADSATSAAIPNCSAVALTQVNGTTYTAQCVTSALNLSSHTITATYAGDANFATSNNTVAQSVTAASTSTAIVSSSVGNTSTVNQSVTFTATVTPNPAGSTSLGGVVSFFDNNVAIGNCSSLTPSVAGIAACTTASLTASASPHTIRVTYTGDANFTSSNNSLVQTVIQGTTTLALSPSANPTTVSQQVTFTATVTPNPLGAVVLSGGSVTFTDNGNAITACSVNGVVPITWNAGASNGTATCATSSLSVGSHNIQAVYASDPNFSGSTNSFSQSVNTATAALTLTAPTSATVNQQVSITATFSASNTLPPATGTVSFVDTSNPGDLPSSCSSVVPTSQTSLGSVTYTASCLTTVLTAGTHVIQAMYSGDVNFSIGSKTTSVVEAQAASTTVVTSSLNPSWAYTSNSSNYKDSVTFTATVTPSNGAILLAGTVAFTDNGTPLAGCGAKPLVGGQASCTSAVLPSGSNSIVATYSSDSNYAGSANTLLQTVEDYALSVTPIPTAPAAIFVSQGFATGSTAGYTTGNTSTAPVDPFTGQAINLNPAPIGGYATLTAAPATLSCAVTPTTGAPKCDLSGTLTIGGNSQAPAGIVIDASASSVVAGTYTVTVTATDPTTTISRAASFTVIVRPVSATVNLVSGQTTGNTGTVTFQLPAGVSLSTLTCPWVFGSGLTGEVAASARGITCTFSPTTVPSTGSAQTATVTVTITTTGTVTAQNNTPVLGKGSSMLLAALFGLPVFLLMGFRRSRRAFVSNAVRMVAIAALAIAAFSSLGCGGSLNFSSTQVQGGTTPPGAYNLLIQGIGSDSNKYQTVLSLNINL